MRVTARATSGCGTDGGGCAGYVPPATNPNALGAGTQTEKVGTTYVVDARPARAFYKFSVSVILPNSNVTTGNIKLYSNGCIGKSEYNCNSNSYNEYFYPVTAPITTGTSTYNDFAAATGTVLNSAPVPAFAPGTRVQRTWGFKAVIDYWIGNNPDAYAHHPNYGFGEKLSSEPSSGNIGGPSFAGPNDTADPHPEVDVTWLPPPGKMAAPTLTAMSGTSLRATFTAPSNDGPAIDSYLVYLYRVGSGTPYTSTTCTAPCSQVNFSSLPYDSYYVTAQAHNSVGYGATSPHSNTVVLSPAPQITKTVLTAADGAGQYARGQSITYKLHISNPIATAMTVNSVTDTLPGTMIATGAVPTLGGVDCIASGDCTVTGNTISATTFTIPGNGAVDLIYSVVAGGVERGCAAVTNTATATNDFGSNTATAVITVCQSGLGMEPWWSYFSKNVGAQSTANVNAMNGNLVVQATDSTPVNARGGFAYVIRRSYNSQETDALTLPGSFGAGWQLNIGQADDLAGAGATTSGLSVPTAESLAAPLAVTMVDRDGTRHVFTYRSLSVNIHAPVDVSTLTLGTAAHLLRPINPSLLPGTGSGASGFPTVCVDAMYQPPPGVHVALWRYVGVNSGCANELSDGSARILGFAAVRPDRLRYDFDVTGHLLDMVNGNGVDLRYTYDTLGRLTSVYEPRTCTGTIGGLGM